MEQNLDILRQEIVDKSLEAFREGLFSGTSGNMSCRVAPDEMLITPTSVRYDVLRAQDIVRMKLDGTVLEGELQPSSEWRMHAAVYKAYGETNAVFHTHSPYATAFAVVRKSIPAVLIESCIFLGGDIRCAAYGLRPSARTPSPRSGTAAAARSPITACSPWGRTLRRHICARNTSKMSPRSTPFPRSSARRWSLPLFNEKNSAENAQGEQK